MNPYVKDKDKFLLRLHLRLGGRDIGFGFGKAGISRGGFVSTRL